MARQARIVVPGMPHHVTQRGSRNQAVFFRDSDYLTYIKLVAQGCQSASTEVWAYCLMPNHVHFILVPREADGLRKALANAHGRYTRAVNQREGWQGHLWQERFHSFPMDETHLLSAARYIEQNPVRAGIVKQPSDWRWSSARAHLDGCDDQLAKVSPLLELVPDWSDYLATEMHQSKIVSLRAHSRSGRPLGSSTFVDRLEAGFERSLRPGRPGRKRGRPTQR